MAKVALLIGVSEYQPGLNPLPAAVKDIAAMREVLEHSDMGGFDQVEVLPNPTLIAMQKAITNLFEKRTATDLVLFYFSGHGVTDELGKFYFTNRETEKNGNRFNKGTAVSAGLIHDLMDNCNSDRQVIILDCCHSGAFPEGMTLRDDGTIKLEQQLGGKGRIVLTSSAALQYSFERQGEDLAIYTRYLVEGIKTGAADRDEDGFVSVDELHDYVQEKVRQAAPAMQPERYVVRDGEKILLAKAVVSDPKRQYRKLVQQYSAEGEIVPAERRLLDRRKTALGLTDDDAIAIETEILQPYRDYRANLQEYEDVLKQEIARAFPLSDRARRALTALQKELGLRDEDVQAISNRLLTPKQADYERQLEEQQQERERLEQQRQQTIARQQEAEQRQQQQAKQPPPTPYPPPHPTFEFETATLVIKKGGGWFGGGKTPEISRRKGQAAYLTENLGNGITLDMVAIPGGQFQMGSNEYDFEKPIHAVTIAPFYMGRYPVTQAQWQEIAALPKIELKLNPDPANFKGAKRPIEQVSWDEAVEFCARLSQKAGKRYRLPTEAEWEYACRAGTLTPFYFGETITTDLANYRGTNWKSGYTTYPGNYGDGPKGTYREQTTDVGSFPANAFGLYDMHGNVWEWCTDQWYSSYASKPDKLKQDGAIAWTQETTGIAPKADETECRLLRGGYWSDPPVLCRSACRYRHWRGYLLNYIGFRVVCVVPRTL